MKSKKTKVAFVLPGLESGGAERVLITLMNNINPARFDCALVDVGQDGPMRQLIKPEIPVHVFGLGHVILSLPKLYRFLKNFKPDVVVSTMAPMNFTVLMLKPFFPNVRFIVREAIVPSFLTMSKPCMSWVIRLAYKILYPQADLILSPAQVILDEFSSVVGMKLRRSAVLYNPVDVENVRAQEGQVFEQPEERKKTVLFVSAGRLHRQKGFDRLIEALGNANFSYPWRLMILGEGSERAALEGQIQELGMEDNVVLKGRLDRPWLDIAQADCFVLPSRWEGLPNVVLEALACGTPVIASREAGGIQEIQNFAGEESVVIAETMAEFVQSMQKISPQNHQAFRPSLLPAQFSMKNIVETFEGYLRS